MNPIAVIILLCIIGPVIGSLLGVLRKPSPFFLFNLISFAAGIMLAVSFLQLIPESLALSSIWICVLGIVSGSIAMFGIDKLIPHLHPSLCSQEHGHHLERTVIYLFLGILIHHFPEGMAMGIGAVSDFGLSFAIAIAIALHDIPEAICTSAPYYFISKNRVKSFIISLSTAIPTVIGFLATYYLFRDMPSYIVGFLIAGTAGLMIYISSDELIPTSSSKLTGHSTIFSLIAGIVCVVFLGLIV